MSQDFRLDNVGMVNREKKISFKFNGKKYFGFEGDTIASALIANGVHLVVEVLNITDLGAFLELALMSPMQFCS